MRRTLGVVTVVIVALLGLARPAEAGRTQSVRISATTPMYVEYGCGEADPTTAPGSFTFERNNTFGSLTITYHIAGGPTDLNADASAGADHTVDFADGAATVTVTVNPAVGGGKATVTVVAGSGYTAGEPSSADVQLAIAVPECVAPTDNTVPPTDDTLARTGVKSTSRPLALTGMVMVTLGTLLLVAASRRKAAA